jgi:hypothetical protein
MRTSTLAVAGRRCNRTISRKRRFVRFLSTTFHPCFGTTIPTLAQSEREADTRASRYSVCIRFPERLKDSRSASLVRRNPRGKPKDLRAGVFGWELNSEPLTSFLATTAKNLAAPFSSHPQPEPVCSYTAFVTRTVGRLTHYSAPETFRIKYS